MLPRRLILPPLCPGPRRAVGPPGPESRGVSHFSLLPQALRGWKQKYDVLLGLVKDPRRLLPAGLAQEVRLLQARRQALGHDRALLQAGLDSAHNMGGAKGRWSDER